MNTQVISIENGANKRQLPKSVSFIRRNDFGLSAWLSAFYLSGIEKLKQLNEYRTNRLAFQQLLFVDDKILADIGVTRQDVHSINKLPLSINAAQKLRIVAFNNRERDAKELKIRLG